MCCSCTNPGVLSQAVHPQQTSSHTHVGVEKDTDGPPPAKISEIRPPTPPGLPGLGIPTRTTDRVAVSAAPAVPGIPPTPPTTAMAVVIGAGLAGTLAAIALKQETYYRSTDVLVLESRTDDAGLDTHLNLRMDTLTMLQRLGLFEEVEKIGGWIQSIRKTTLTSDGFAEASHFSPLEPPSGSIPTRLSESASDMLKKPIVFQVRVRDFVRVLRDHAEKIGVRFQFNCTAEAQMRDDGKISVQMNRHETVCPEMLVFAEGARRKTVGSLGVPCVEGRETAHYLSGVVKKEVGPYMRRRIMPYKNTKTIVRTMCVGHAIHKEGWGLAEVPQEKYNALSTAPAEKRKKYFRKHVETLIGREPLGEDDIVGGDVLFTVRNSHTTRGSVGTNGLLFGDTLRVAHFATSPGANGLFYDVQALIDAANAGMENPRTLEDYSTRVMQTTEACIASGMPEFVSMES